MACRGVCNGPGSNRRLIDPYSTSVAGGSPGRPASVWPTTGRFTGSDWGRPGGKPVDSEEAPGQSRPAVMVGV
jgi:hypothetical protein